LCDPQHRPFIASEYDFTHANWASIISYLEYVNFDDLFTRCDNVGSVVACFYYVVYEAFDQYVPAQRVYNRSNLENHHPRKLLCKKANAWQVYRNFCTDAFVNAYKVIATQCR
jgi:hypothetical protein